MVYIKTTIDAPRGSVDELVDSSTEAIFIVRKPAFFTNGLDITGSVNFQSGSSPSSILYATSSQTAQLYNNFTVLADASLQDIIISLPDATLKQGINLFIKKVDATAHTVTVLPYGSQTIDGEISQIITGKNVSMQLVSYLNWYII